MAYLHIFTYIYHTSKPNVGEYPRPTEHMGYIAECFFKVDLFLVPLKIDPNVQGGPKSPIVINGVVYKPYKWP